jgi:pSer/pThr/pTyr-binding forkhead associated (FHA) protein
MEITLQRLDETEEQGFILETGEFSVAQPEFVIGRAHDCQLQLPSGFVSRHHCELIVDEREHALRLRDLGSRNGTFVNDEIVAEERELKDGDRLTVGCIPFEIHIA